MGHRVSSACQPARTETQLATMNAKPRALGQQLRLAGYTSQARHHLSLLVEQWHFVVGGGRTELGKLQLGVQVETTCQAKRK